MNWVDVRDEMPPLNQEVLVLDQHGRVMWTKRVPWVNPPHEPSWKCIFQNFTPTHWMNLEVPFGVKRRL